MKVIIEIEEQDDVQQVKSIWDKEISERVRAVDEGTAIGVDYDEAMQQIEQCFA